LQKNRFSAVSKQVCIVCRPVFDFSVLCSVLL
jgi:hypothetical protein